MKILITGAAGFIGFSLAQRLLERGEDVIGLDNFNDYYDPKLKQARARELEKRKNYIGYSADVCDEESLLKIFQNRDINIVIHLAAQVGVRNSIHNPSSYIKDNIVGFFNVLNLANQFKVKHFLYASSSSVYGGCENLPYTETQNINKPLSLYAATKAADELIAHAYSSSYGIPTTGLRFFTVYGPWGRPDMALFKFTKLMLNGEALPIFNNGMHLRDFTYIDDVVDGILAVLDKSNNSTNSSNEALNANSEKAKIFNVGNDNPIKLLDYIAAIELALGIKAKINFMPRQLGDVVNTHASIEDLKKYVGYSPRYSVVDGIQKFVDWYTSYFKDEIENERI